MKKVLVIVGPTAIGKTKLSVELAKQLNGEIISGDSIQVYRQLTIGSAKVTSEEQEGVAHHLIDMLDYKEAYSVKDFQTLGRAWIEDISNRGKLPIVCGGTGLYIKALLYDYEFSEEQVDEAYTAYVATLSKEEQYTALLDIDPESAKSIHPNNQQRVIRALIMAHSGKRRSDVIAAQNHSLLYDAKFIGLTMPRELLYNRINQRVDGMVEAGLLEELDSVVENLATFQLQSMQGIGYKEFLPYYEKTISLDEVLEKIKKNSRNFAKRQYTWFHNQLPVEWYDVTQAGYEDVLKEEVVVWRNQK
ncbi:MAG: tRNA (adenosine(37)-N6)-dimethylallyltransferase MiaA [Erysipelotrichaceae bacterium]